MMLVMRVTAKMTLVMLLIIGMMLVIIRVMLVITEGIIIILLRTTVTLMEKIQRIPVLICCRQCVLPTEKSS
jgi:hypothetical protein